jgi:prepilin-type N-terminal cleavage/methylation domain-containing protein
MSLKRIDHRGFTLIEIAIVLVIIGILAGGGVELMSVLSQRKIRNESLDYLNEAKGALISFAKINGRLPLADGNGDGVEDAGTFTGTLPFQTLGISPADANLRPLKYALNNQLGANISDGCGTLRGALAGAPLVVDSDGATAAFPVAAVLVSAGPKDADGDGDVFDDVSVGAHQGDNTDGVPNYIRFPPTTDFDDLVVYIDRLTLYSEMCGNPQLAVSRGTATTANMFIFNRTTGLDIGILASGDTRSYDIISGSQIELRTAGGGGGAIVASTPAMPTYIAGSGIAVTVP